MKAGADVLGVAINADDGQRIGKVHDLLFDDRCSRVTGLVVRSGLVFRTSRVIGFSQVQAIGPDAVTVAIANARPPNADEVAALGSGRRSMQGRPVVTRGGEYLGAVRDVLFDEDSGLVLGFEVAYPKGNGRPGDWPGTRTVCASVASDKVVVADG